MKYSVVDIERYLKREMTFKERHDFESQALEDPFLYDAIEGYLKLKRPKVERDKLFLKLKNVLKSLGFPKKKLDRQLPQDSSFNKRRDTLMSLGFTEDIVFEETLVHELEAINSNLDFDKDKMSKKYGFYIAIIVIVVILLLIILKNLIR